MNLLKNLKSFIILLILFLNNGILEAKVLTRCELVDQLKRNNFNRSLLSNWVCLIEHESGRDTSKVTRYTNLSSSYGIFQINSKLWCREGRKGGICNMRCEDFLNDSIGDGAICAKKIFDRDGFQGWNGWVKKCRGQTLPDISRC